MKTKLFICSLIMAMPVMAQDTIQESATTGKSNQLVEKIKSFFEKKTLEQKGDMMYDYYNFSKASFYYAQEDSLTTSAMTGS